MAIQPTVLRISRPNVIDHMQEKCEDNDCPSVATLSSASRRQGATMPTGSRCAMGSDWCRHKSEQFQQCGTGLKSKGWTIASPTGFTSPRNFSSSADHRHCRLDRWRCYEAAGEHDELCSSLLTSHPLSVFKRTYVATGTFLADTIQSEYAQLTCKNSDHLLTDSLLI